MDIAKAHAYGNDFLLVPAAQADGIDAAGLARAVCARRTGIGADGLILYRWTERGAVMQLLNADGSPSELSGNGVRCLAALLVAHRARSGDDVGPGMTVVVETDAGDKTLRLLEAVGDRYTFHAAMGAPEDVRPLDLDVAGQPLRVIVLTMGNPQCIVLDGAVTDARLHEIGPVLTKHEAFPHGTNVELVDVESPDRLRILIWERGVGPTEASGTGACASAVAAALYGSASRHVDVVSSGGSQHVDWEEDGVYLTGWAQLVVDGRWLPR